MYPSTIPEGERKESEADGSKNAFNKLPTPKFAQEQKMCIEEMPTSY